MIKFKKVTYEYFISYSHSKGHGNIQFSTNKKIDSFNHIKEIQENIQNINNHIDGIVINNFILINVK